MLPDEEDGTGAPSRAAGTGQGPGLPADRVVGNSPLAAGFRRLVTAVAIPGWDLHPVPVGCTPLHALAGPLQRLPGHNRLYNLLERKGFGYVEEVAVTPEACLLEFRNSGPRLITAVRQVLADLGLAEVTTERTACLLQARPVRPRRTGTADRLARGRGRGTAGRGGPG